MIGLEQTKTILIKIIVFVSVIQKSLRYANYVEFMHCNKGIMGRDAIYSPVTYRKIVI